LQVWFKPRLQILENPARTDRESCKIKKPLPSSFRRSSGDDWQELYNQIVLSPEFGDLVIKLRWPKTPDDIRTTHVRPRMLFYLQLLRSVRADFLKNLKAAGLNQTWQGSWARASSKNPFGSDLASARELTAPSAILLPKSKRTGSIIFWGKKRRRTPCAALLPTRSSRRSGHALHRPCANHGGRNARRGGRAGYYETAAPIRDMVQKSYLLSAPLLDGNGPPTT